LIPVDSLGDVFSKRVAWGRIVAVGLTLGGGFFVDAWPTFSGRPPLEAYSVLFSIGLLFGLAGVGAITRLPGPPLEVGHALFYGLHVRAFNVADAFRHDLDRRSTIGNGAFGQDLGNPERPVFEQSSAIDKPSPGGSSRKN
jgi:hypothetical protein